MVEYNGGFQTYPDRVTKNVFFRAEGRATKPVTVKSGQVLKALSFLETDSAGKAIAHGPLTEGTFVKFAAITNGQTIILGGLTFTAGSSGTTAAQLATSWAGIAAGTAAASITWAVGGTFTGTLTGWGTEAYDADSVIFNSSAPLTNATDLAATGTATAPTLTKVDGATTFSKIAGVLVYDVDASSADVDAQAYSEASFWADALVWAADPTQDTITKPDGTTVAVSAYNTGCAGTSAASNLLKKKFVEGSEFDPLGFKNAGDYV
ncbi:MAG: hypothetical protein M0R47_19020 [Methylobacter sp.]|uniref:hypothetical protein n=1 Tax=Methylobacter sp. TaxID=2051955 RepID=UPI0025DC0732|nr:hypothetical protein [Methylobacter sp.]MCK9622614.1 hypothetical protein [Methylobacter sp.]